MIFSIDEKLQVQLFWMLILEDAFDIWHAFFSTILQKLLSEEAYKLPLSLVASDSSLEELVDFERVLESLLA
jgi:hypothetical protein